MTREEYLRRLQEQLEKFGNELQQEIMEDYAQHFAEGEAEGRTDEEIIQELGNIEDMIRELRYTEAEVQQDRSGGLSVQAQGGQVSGGANADGTAGGTGSAAQGSGNTAWGAENAAQADSTEQSDDKAGGKEYKSIVLKSCVADVFLVKSEDNAIHVDYKNDGSMVDKMKYEFYQYEKDGVFYAGVRKNRNYNDGTQRSFSFGPTTITFHNNFSAGWRNEDIVLTVRVPERIPEVKVEAGSGDIQMNGLILPKFKAVTTSGDVNMSGIVLEKLDVTTASGDITQDGVVVDTQNFTTASGDFDMKNVKSCKTNIVTASGDVSCVKATFEKLDVKTASGDVNLQVDAGQYHLVTASGDVNLITGTAPEKVEANTASGDIYFTLAKVEGAEVKVSSRSGDVSVSQKGNDIKVQNGSVYTFGDGACKVSAGTVSGDIGIIL